MRQIPISKIMKPTTFATSIINLDTKQTLDYISELMLTTYVFGQFGLYHELTTDQEEILMEHISGLAKNLGTVLTDKYNDVVYVWARENSNNYAWIYKVWKNLSKKYFEFSGQEHESVKYQNYFEPSKIF